MSSVIGGVISLVLLFGAGMLLANTVLGIGIGQQRSLDTAAKTSGMRLRTSISISSAIAVDQGSTTGVTVQIGNDGSVGIIVSSTMDVFVSYTDTTDAMVREYLEYTSGAPGANQWTLTSISPDTFNEGIWDSDETVTLDLVLSPEIKTGTSGIVLVATPTGITDSAYFDAP